MTSGNPCAEAGCITIPRNNEEYCSRHQKTLSEIRTIRANEEAAAANRERLQRNPLDQNAIEPKELPSFDLSSKRTSSPNVFIANASLFLREHVGDEAESGYRAGAAGCRSTTELFGFTEKVFNRFEIKVT